MAIKYIDDNGPDGAVFGQTSASLVAFWGATPAAQAAVTAAAGTTNATTTTPWGFATSTQANGITTLVDAMRTIMINSGLMAAS